MRLPLKKSPHIAQSNALIIDWHQVVGPKALSYIVGNPPFVGKAFQTEAQKAEIASIFHDINGAGVLDYVSCWYRKALDFMHENPAIRTAFVSTNSITQGEQVGVLWPLLFAGGARINFAHRTFQWSSEGRGQAAVHCVVIGLALQDEPTKWLFDYETVRSEPHAIKAKNINPYLVDGPDVALTRRGKPISNVPAMLYGSKPADGGNLILSPEEKAELLLREPAASPWIRRYVGSEEFINSIERWCLWLVGISPEQLRAMPMVLRRVEAVRAMRAASTKKKTREQAETPTLFAEIRHSGAPYLIVPEVSSENRRFIPIGFSLPDVVASNLVYTVPNATLYHFGVLSSTMHMAWVRAVCGRLKSDYRYSAGIVYNNFPWPDIDVKNQQAIERAAQQVLDARAVFPNATLADLYNPLSMPPDLNRAHQALDRVVDISYGKSRFSGEAERVAFLFELYRTQVPSLGLGDSGPRQRKKTRNS